MNKVNVKKADLLEKLKLNRGNHHNIFLEAQEGYRKAVIAELDRMLEDARKGRKIRRHISLPEPHDHTKDYDVAIKMVEMSVDESICLSMHDFQNFVLDVWDWSESFSSTSMSYSSSSSSSLSEDDDDVGGWDDVDGFE